MTLKTIPVGVTCIAPDGSPAAGAVVAAQLVDANGKPAATFDGDVVVPVLVQGVAGDTGKARLGLWPNQRGVLATLYRVTAKLGAFEILNVLVAVPDGDPLVEIAVKDIANSAPWPALGAAQLAVQTAQAAAFAAAADRALADADKNQTALDRVQTGLDRTQTGIDRAGVSASANGANSFMLTAVAQAALAATMAASAGSVAQQDLSAVSGYALYRSPAAINAIAHMDTSKDGDGGAWTQRGDQLSYIAQAILNGTWINSALQNFMGIGAGNSAGAQTSNNPEIVARAMGGTLGPNLLGTVYTPLSGGSVVANASGGLDAACAAGQFAAGSQAFATEIGVTYLVTGRVTSAALGRIYVNDAAGLSTPETNAGNLLGGFAFVTTAVAVTTYLMPGANVAGNTVSYADLKLQKVVAWAPSGGYFPNATDGKNYRIYKNRSPVSEQLDNALWSKTNLTPTANADGTADLLVENTTNGFHSVSGVGMAPVIGIVHGSHVRLKPAGRTWAWMQIGTKAAYFNLTGGGVLGTVNSGLVATITQATDQAGYYDLSVVGLADTGVCTFGFASADNVASYLGDGASGMYVQRAHQEVGGFTGYEQRTTVGVGMDETFGGNKARPPRYGIAVGETGRVTILDALSSGFPMWMVFRCGVSANDMLRGGGITGASYVQGCLLVSTTAGLALVDFAGDRAFFWSSGGLLRYRGKIADRNSGSGWDLVDSTKALANSNVNAVSACTMPDAPVDPTTLLPVPTIAAFTTGGISAIQSDGTVRNSASTGSYTNGSINPYLLSASSSAGTLYSYALKPGSLGASFALTTTNFGMSTAWGGMTVAGRGTLVRRQGARLDLWRLNESNVGAGSLQATIGDTYNTGWMLNPIRAWGCDVSAGVVSNQAVVIDDFSNPATLANYLVQDGNITRAIAGGVITLTTNASAGSDSVYYSSWPTVPGATYVVTAAFAVGSNCTGGYFNARNGAVQTAPAVATQSGNVAPGSASLTPSLTFVADGPLTTIRMGMAKTQNDASGSFDNLTIQLTAIADRSHKGKQLPIFGSLTKTAVAAGAQAVFYGGFSAANYGQEAYSADWDVGMSATSWRVPMIVQPTQQFASGAEQRTTGAVGLLGAATVATYNTGTGDGTCTRVDASNQSYVQCSGLAAGTYWVGLTNTGAVTITIRGGGPGGGTSVNVPPGQTLSGHLAAVGGQITITSSAAATATWTGFSIKQESKGVAMDRSSAGGGASQQAGMNPDGTIFWTVTDSAATTRTVTTTQAYNTGQPVIAELCYSQDGTLCICVSGKQVAATTGAPLASLSNATAVVTWGNSRDGLSPFPGQLAMTIAQAGAPFAEQSQFAYEQQSRMFQPGAQITLPDSGALVDTPDYDDALDGYRVGSAGNSSRFNGLNRVAAHPVTAGSISRVSGRAGMRLEARSGTNPGVDITVPSQNLKEELLRREEAAARRARQARQVRTYRATAGQTSIPLGVDDDLVNLFVGGVLKTEGGADDYTVGWDGFKPTVTYPAGIPLNTVIKAEVRRQPA